MRRVEINESCAETLAVLVRRKAEDSLLVFLFRNSREWVRAVTDLLLMLGFLSCGCREEKGG